MKLVPLHALIRDSSQQSYALQSGPDAKGKAMRGRRFGESAETSAATAAGAGGPSKALGKGGGAKSEQAIARIMGAVKTNIIFSRLNDLQLQMLQSAMAEHAVPAGADVITQGEKGNHFFVVDVRIPVSAIQHLGRPIPALPASLPVLTRGRWIDTVRGSPPRIHAVLRPLPVDLAHAPPIRPHARLLRLPSWHMVGGQGGRAMAARLRVGELYCRNLTEY